MSYESRLKEFEASNNASMSAENTEGNALPSNGQEVSKDETNETLNSYQGDGSEAKETNDNRAGGKKQFTDAEKEAYGLRKRMEKMLQRQKMMQQRLDELQGNKPATEQPKRKTRKDFASDDEYIEHLRTSSMDEITSKVYERYASKMKEQEALQKKQNEFYAKLQSDLPKPMFEKVNEMLTDEMCEQMELLQTPFGQALQNKIVSSPIGTHILGLLASKPHIFNEIASADQSEWGLKLALLEHDLQRFAANVKKQKAEEPKQTEASNRSSAVPIVGGFGQTNGSMGENLENLSSKERIAKFKAMYQKKR